MCICLGNLLKRLYFLYYNSMHSTTHHLYDNILQGHRKSLKHGNELTTHGLSVIYLPQECLMYQINAKDNKCSSTSVKKLDEQVKKYHCRDAFLKTMCRETPNMPYLPFPLPSSWSDRKGPSQLLNRCMKFTACLIPLMGHLFPLLSHKVRVPVLSSESGSKQLVPVSIVCPAVHFKERTGANVILCLIQGKIS